MRNYEKIYIILKTGLLTCLCISIISFEAIARRGTQRSTRRQYRTPQRGSFSRQRSFSGQRKGFTQMPKGMGAIRVSKKGISQKGIGAIKGVGKPGFGKAGKKGIGKPGIGAIKGIGKPGFGKAGKKTAGWRWRRPGWKWGVRPWKPWWRWRRTAWRWRSGWWLGVPIGALAWTYRPSDAYLTYHKALNFYLRDRMGYAFWEVINRTGENITILTEDRQDPGLTLDYDQEYGSEIWHSNSYNIRIITESGRSQVFYDIQDHFIEVYTNENGELQIETWNE